MNFRAENNPALSGSLSPFVKSLPSNDLRLSKGTALWEKGWLIRSETLLILILIIT